ncbi:hypothetical protein EVG20_g434 [Dentipellis fragilis]|uniref:Uncharacterized protein n=1 Tax=Dentipellis fragilis TaxID=205917 RepID=A0A4Y9ZDN6_9AGAM|nr:hypothetical protein EVG20_g434 [Dentipellis fragilis]
MGSICLSQVPILRCLDLARIETIVLIIPPALEIIFSLGLVIAGWGAGKKRFILAAEGPIYFLLALLDLICHIVPGIRDSIATYKTLDILIGTLLYQSVPGSTADTAPAWTAALSSVPLFLYTTFLYLYKTTEFFPLFPRRFQLIGKVFSLVLIPILLLTNEFASFIGNTYRLVQFSPFEPPVPAIGNGDASMQSIRDFLNSLGLVLLTVYQVATFFIVIVHLAAAIVNQRSIEAQANEDNEAHLFRGTGWMALGIKFGAIESIIGFATGSFGIFFTRRFLRMISRACIIIGVVRGPDSHEDFEIMQPKRDRTPNGPATRQITISDPQLVSSSMLERDGASGRPMLQPIATFGQRNRLSMQTQTTNATGTYPSNSTFTSPMSDAPAPPLPSLALAIPATAAEARPRPRKLNLNHRRSTSTDRGDGAHGRRARADARPAAVRQQPAQPRHHHGHGLLARLAGRRARRRQLPTPTAQPSAYPCPSLYSCPCPMPEEEQEQYLEQGYEPDLPSPKPRYAYTGARGRVLSASSITSDSLDYVRNLSSSFTSLPPRVTGKYRGSVLGVVADQDEGPDPRGAALERDTSGRSAQSSMSRSSSVKRKPPPAYEETLAADAREAELGAEEDGNDSDTGIDETDAVRRVRAMSENSVHSGQWVSSSVRDSARTAMDVERYRRGTTTSLASVLKTPGTAGTMGTMGTSPDTAGALEIDWIANPEVVSETDEAWQRSQQRRSKIKSMGRAPRHRTPPPTTVVFSRESVVAETEEMPLDAMEKVANSARSTLVRKDSSVTLVRKDSGVLGVEDTEFVRRSLIMR